MKTKAPSSMKPFAAARPMPVAPPVMTATLPSSFPMTSPSRLPPLVARGQPETLDIGPPGSGVECGNAHIGGAKSIRLDDRRQPPRWVCAVRNWAALVEIGYIEHPYCYTIR